MSVATIPGRASPRATLVAKFGYSSSIPDNFSLSKIAFLVGPNLTERMKCEMRGFLNRTERNGADLIRLAYFFQRPANACIARQPLAAIG